MFLFDEFWYNLIFQYYLSVAPDAPSLASTLSARDSALLQSLAALPPSLTHAQLQALTGGAGAAAIQALAAGGGSNFFPYFFNFEKVKKKEFDKKFVEKKLTPTN